MDKTKVSKVICEDALEELQPHGWSTTILLLNFVWHFSCLAAFFHAERSLLIPASVPEVVGKYDIMYIYGCFQK